MSEEFELVLHIRGIGHAEECLSGAYNAGPASC